MRYFEFSMLQVGSVTFTVHMCNYAFIEIEHGKTISVRSICKLHLNQTYNNNCSIGGKN